MIVQTLIDKIKPLKTGLAGLFRWGRDYLIPDQSPGREPHPPGIFESEPQNIEQGLTNSEVRDCPMEKRRQVIAIDCIEEWAEVNPRRDYDEGQLDLLGESLSEVGQVDAVKVNQVGNNPELVQWLLIDGKRRIEGAKRVGQTEIEADVYFNLSVGEALALVGTTLQKRSFNVIEEARLLAGMEVNGHSIKHICDVTGFSETTVVNRIKIYNELIDYAQQLMVRKNNPLPIHQALLLCKLNNETQAKMADKIAPATGRVMPEDEARELVKSVTDKTMSLDLDSEEETPQNQQSKISNQKSNFPPSGAQDGPLSSKNDPHRDGPPASIKKPGKGTNKHPESIGVNQELAVNINIQGTLITKRTGVKVQDAKLLLEGGVIAQDLFIKDLGLNIGEDDIKAMCAFAAEANELPESE